MRREEGNEIIEIGKKTGEDKLRLNYNQKLLPKRGLVKLRLREIGVSLPKRDGEAEEQRTRLGG